MGHSTEGYLSLPGDVVLCANSIESARNRTGPERVKSITDTCTHDGIGYFSVLTPMGGLVPKGYILLVTDPAFSLKETERDMGNPIQIRYPSSAVSFQSQAWPTDLAHDNFIHAVHVVKNHRGEEVLTVTIARDIQRFQAKLSRTIWLALGLSVGILIPIILITVILMRKELKQLDDLVKATDDLGKGKQVRIESSSFPEINIVVHSFNQMSQDIHRLVEGTQQANRAKSAFLANMSHEIRTPLAAVIGYAGYLLDQNVTRKEHDGYVETIVNNSKHLLNIINDILDLSKIEANKIDVELMRVSPLDVLREVETVLGPLAREKGLEFRAQVAYPLPQLIDSDPTRLKQILLNVSGNAIKFTEKGGVSVTCGYDMPGNSVVFTFSDTGIGMDEQALSRIFRPFSQADVSTTRKFGGTGLGLSISKQLANLLGGDLVCTSERGKGTTFTLTIAAGHVDSEHMLQSEPKPQASKSTTAVVQGLRVKGRVLVAEDNPDIQRLVKMYLVRTGAEVDLVENGQLAVEKAMSSRYDLVFMDMQMPVMDGVEATETLRSRGYQGAIVALTANAMKEDRERYLGAGVNEFLAKPVDLTAFYAVVGQYLQKIETRPAV